MWNAAWTVRLLESTQDEWTIGIRQFKVFQKSETSTQKLISANGFFSTSNKARTRMTFQLMRPIGIRSGYQFVMTNMHVVDLASRCVMTGARRIPETCCSSFHLIKFARGSAADELNVCDFVIYHASRWEGFLVKLVSAWCAQVMGKKRTFKSVSIMS